MNKLRTKLILACVMAALCLASWVAPSSAQDLLTQSQRAWIDKHGALKVGCFSDYPPFGFAGSEGKTQGIAVDFWKLMAKKLDVPVIFFSLQLTGQLDGLADGQFDSLAGVFRLPSREKRFAFSKPYAVIDTYIWVRPSHKDLKGWAGLKGLKVAAVRDDSGQVLARQHGIKPRLYGNYQSAVMALVDGEVDALVMDELVVAYFAYTRNLQGRLLRAGPAVASGEMCLPVLKGRTVLWEILNRGVAAVSDQEWQAIVNKWLGR